MAKSSVLTQAEKASIEIKRFIFHIIIEKEDYPTYLDEIILDGELELFFRERLIEASSGTQYIFNDTERSQVYEHCKLISESPENSFVKSSEVLTALFKDHHTGTTNDGVFVIALVTIEGARNLVFLLKFDHTKVYEYKTKGRQAIIEQVKNTFIEDKRAVQKIAIVNTSNHYSWDVLAQDRTALHGIRDYFRKYLSVVERETPSKLTKDSIAYARQWAIDNKAIIEVCGQEPSHYKQRAIDYMKNNDVFDSEQFVKAVIFDDDSERRKQLELSFTNFLAIKGVAGQSFAPAPGAIDAATRKNKRETAEGVKIEWIGEMSHANITISNQQGQDGLYEIIIRTSNLKVIS